MPVPGSRPPRKGHAFPFPPGYPKEVPCGHCGTLTTVPGPPPSPGLKPMCGLCLHLSMAHLSPQERAALIVAAKKTRDEVVGLDLAGLVAMHRRDADHDPRSLQECYLMALRGLYGMGRLLTVLSENGVELPLQPQENPS
jgi:hypothetical protein